MLTDSELDRPDVIMLVEDCESHAELFVMALEKCGIKNPLIVFDNPEDALKFVYRNNNAKKIGLVFMDVRMPLINGFEAIEIMRGVIPIDHFVILSDSDSDEDLIAASRLNISRYIFKSYQSEEHFRSSIMTELKIASTRMTVRC